MSKQFNIKDPFFERAKKEGYRARSVYKLDAIQKKYKLVKKGDTILDIGSAPGSFLQLLSKLTGHKGIVIGIDLKVIDPLDELNVHTIVHDVFDNGLNNVLNKKFGIKKFNVITSDLAPKTSGIHSVDSGRSIELDHSVLDAVQILLKTGGKVVIKYFPGAEEKSLLDRTKNLFSKVSVFTPPAVRKSSREKYIIATGFIERP